MFYGCIRVCRQYFRHHRRFVGQLVHWISGWISIQLEYHCVFFWYIQFSRWTCNSWLARWLWTNQIGEWDYVFRWDDLAAQISRVDECKIYPTLDDISSPPLCVCLSYGVVYRFKMLCEECQKIFCGRQMLSEIYFRARNPHHSSLQSIIDASASGCWVCHRLLASLSREIDIKDTLAEISPLIKSSTWHFYRVSDQGRWFLTFRFGDDYFHDLHVMSHDGRSKLKILPTSYTYTSI